MEDLCSWILLLPIQKQLLTIGLDQLGLMAIQCRGSLSMKVTIATLAPALNISGKHTCLHDQAIVMVK